MFLNRLDAGNKLKNALEKYKKESPIILAIPRGGLIVAYSTITNLNLRWDFLIPRKIRAPFNKEIAIGAVSSDGTYFIDNDYANKLNISKEYIENEVTIQLRKINNRLDKYRPNKKFPNLENETVIIIYDGIATGFTIKAAIKSLRKENVKKIVIAIPVSPKISIEKLNKEVDEIICLYSPNKFYSIDNYYHEFSQVTDEQMRKIIKKSS